MKESELSLHISKLNFFLEKLFYQKNKFNFDNLNIKLINKKNAVITLYNIKFANFGYNKNLIRGGFFNKHFKIKIGDIHKNINFKLLNSGISADINFNENQKKHLKWYY